MQVAKHIEESVPPTPAKVEGETIQDVSYENKSFPKLLPPQEKIELETDRYKLQAGIRFVITDIFIMPSAKYGAIAKFNGYDPITKQRLKYRYTGKRIVQQAKDLLTGAGADEAGHLKQQVKVLVGEYRTENGTGLEFIDPA